MKRTLRAAVLAGLAWPALAGSAAGAATPAFPAAPPAAPAAVEGAVIVQFRADSATLRARAMAAPQREGAAAAAATAQVLQQRAASLAQRAGRALETGAAISPFSQVVRAVGVDSATLAAVLSANPEVEFAVPDRRARVRAAPNDPLYPAASRAEGPNAGQWYLRAPTAAEPAASNFEAAWTVTVGRPQVVVAVLDTGVRPEHPDLRGRLLPGQDLVSSVAAANDGDGRDADPADPGDWVSSADIAGGQLGSDCTNADIGDSRWHGTGTTALIGAVTDEGVGMAGAARGVSLLPVRVLGKCGGSDSDIQAGMRWAAGLEVPGLPRNPHPARVINLSLGGEGACSAAYQRVVDEVRALGVLVVAAAGNSNGFAVNAPANCRGVVSVAALRHVGSKVGFSDLGPEITLSAPGGNCVNLQGACLYPILTASDSGARGPVAPTWSNAFDATFGTSYSSPLVAAAAALVLSVRPAATPDDLTALLRGTARPFPATGADPGIPQCRAPDSVAQDQCYCTAATCGAGMLDAGRAVAAAVQPLAAFDAGPAVAGQPLLLTSTALPADGRRIVRWAWTLVDGGGIATGFSGPTDGLSATLLTSGPGTVRVRLTVTDDAGDSASSDRAIAVSAVAPPAPASGGGGGASHPGWLVGLLAAAWALRRRR